jgi:hypothetical protein
MKNYLLKNILYEGTPYDLKASRSACDSWVLRRGRNTNCRRAQTNCENRKSVLCIDPWGQLEPESCRVAGGEGKMRRLFS